MKTKTMISTKMLVMTAMFAAIIAVLSQLSIPMPSGVPITLQTFAIALCGYVLGSVYGTTSCGVYLLIGAIGLPVFANFSGGFSKLVGVTGGFLWGFLLMTFLCGISLSFKQKWLRIPFGIIGLILCHLSGIAQFSLLTGNTFLQSALIVSIPYLIKDILSVVAAYLLSIKLRKLLWN